MMANTGLPAGSRAMLIGVSAYEYAEFPPIRAARNSLQAMQSLLGDPALGGWPPELITVIANPISAEDLAVRVADFAENTTGVLLLYYVGHGVLSPRGELCLTVTSTRPNRPKITGLPWETVAGELHTSPARPRLVILDCCFAGQAIEALGADSDNQGLADITHVDGVYTLTATTRNRTAHVPPAGEQDTACTSFTGELWDLVRSGIRGKPAQLTFSDIYPELRQRLKAKNLPAPSQRGTDTAHQFPFTVNAAAATRRSTSTRASPKSPQPAWPDRMAHARILTDALRAAWSIPDEKLKATALADIVGAAATADPDRAARLAADAEQIAQSITDKRSKASTLAGIAEKAATADPDRAARLAAAAEHIAQSITDEDWDAALLEGIAEKSSVLTSIAKAVAVADPDRAERIARSMTSAHSKALALIGIAEAAAASDSGRAARLIADAEHIAQSITDERSKASTLAHIARAVAFADSGKGARLIADAEHIAQSITDKRMKASTLTEIAEAAAVADPNQAARLVTQAAEAAESIPAQSILSEFSKVCTLAHVAKAAAKVERDEATRLIADAERIAQSIADEDSREWALAFIADATAVMDPDRAEHIAQSITYESSKAYALAAIARTVAATDPDRAERIAQSIADESSKEKSSALTAVATVVAAVNSSGTVG
jgi:hypothetical protein